MHKLRFLIAFAIALMSSQVQAQDTTTDLSLLKGQIVQQQRFAKIYEDAAAKQMEIDPSKAEQLIEKAEQALAKAAELNKKVLDLEQRTKALEESKRLEADAKVQAEAEKNRLVVRSLTVHCDIKNEDKEKPGSFKVQVWKDGKMVYERAGWGLEEGWDDNTAHSTASADVSSQRLDPSGQYTLKVWIDNGKRIDVATDFYVTIADSGGTTRQSTHASHFWRNGQSSAEWSLTGN